MTSQPDSIRVAFLAGSGLEGRGGIERLGLYMTRQFLENIRDIDIHPFATRSTNRPILKHLATAPACFAFWRACSARRFDIVHLNVAPRGSTWRKMLFGAIARWTGVRVLIHLHGSGYDDFFRRQPAWRQWLIRHFFGSADAVVVLGAYWEKFATAGLNVSPHRVHVIVNGVPPPTSPTADWPGPPLVVCMGAVGERKGTDVLIDALATLPSDAAWQTVIGGNGDLRKFEARAHSLGIGDKVRFLGWVDEAEVDRWLRRAAIFVLPSRAENQPMAILEAMARALPVISTRIGAIPEQVADGETGIVVPPGDAEALGAALRLLLGSAKLRERMGLAGHRRYEERFSVAACADAFARRYRALAATPRATSTPLQGA